MALSSGEPITRVLKTPRLNGPHAIELGHRDLSKSRPNWPLLHVRPLDNRADGATTCHAVKTGGRERHGLPSLDERQDWHRRRSSMLGQQIGDERGKVT